jgi:hypothetical protein
MTAVHVTVEFVVSSDADFEAEQHRVADALFDLETRTSEVTDAAQIGDSAKRFVALSIYAEGKSVDQATASALTAIIGAVEKSGSAGWVWQATHVTPAELVQGAKNPQLLSA